MRVLFVSSLYTPELIGGAELTLVAIADALAARGHEVCVLCTGARSGDDTLPSGVQVIRKRIANVFPLVPVRAHSRLARAAWHAIDSFNPLGFFQTRQAIRCFRPDVVITDRFAGISVAAWLAADAEHCPIIHRVCDSYLLSPSLNVLFAPKRSHAAMFRRMLRLPHRALSRRVAAVVGLSQAVIDLHRERGFFCAVPVEVIPTAYRGLPAPLETPRGSLRLGFLGQLVPTKGIEALLQGFVDADVDATLSIAGSGDPRYVTALERRFADPRIRFLGWTTDKPAYFAQIDLCVVPSQIYDTLPTVIIEAFASGVPVIASSIGGIPEMIVEGQSGFVTELGTPSQVAAAIRRVAADPEKIAAMRQSIPAAAARFLDPIGQIDRWESLARRVIAGHCADAK
jgi:glycosyltransferase involved in cell wall biosynthesis